MLEEALEHLVTGIVDNKDEVQVRRKDQRRGEVLEVRVHPDDLGRVIGRSGRTASALRTVSSRMYGMPCRCIHSSRLHTSTSVTRREHVLIEPISCVITAVCCI